MRLALLPLILLAAGCAAGGPDRTDWQRSDSNVDETVGDEQACRHTAEARIAEDQKIDQDVGTDQTSQGGLATNLDEYQTEKRLNEMIRGCMAALGYHPAGQGPS